MKKYKSRSDLSVEMWILAVMITFILVYFVILIALMMLIYGKSLKEIFLLLTGLPWQLYVIFGGILAFCYLLFLGTLLFSKKTFLFDEKGIEIEGKKGEKIAREDVSFICYLKYPLFLMPLAYDSYAVAVIQSKDLKRRQIMLFPHTVKKLQKLGYLVVYDKLFNKLIRDNYILVDPIIKLDRVEKIFLSYDAKDVTIKVDFWEEAKDCEDYIRRVEIGKGFHKAETLIRHLPKEKFELYSLSNATSRRAKKHKKFLCEMGITESLDEKIE